ncbi:MAG: hypothetical protein DHS20C01_24280 [marine bacterium B5-7]|nr:MAG: hypothetical protein DHS20C01_24280 [marine bacterium B5-7]
MPINIRTILLSRWMRLLVILLLVGLVAIFIRQFDLANPDSVKAIIERVGMLAPILFIILFAVAAVAFIPATVMVLVGGALFGPWFGTLYNLFGATLGAVLAFLISRYLAQGFASRRSGKYLDLVLRGVREEGWRFVLAIRLVGVPYFLLNYLLGLAPIGVVPYLLATFFGMLPSMAVVTYAGHLGVEVISGTDGLFVKLLLLFVLIGALALIPIGVRMYRRRNASILHL